MKALCERKSVEIPVNNLSIAISNNAKWCELVANSHGIQSQWLEDVWYTTSTMPPFYPNVVSLKREINPEIMSTLLRELPERCGWKDSFGTLKLEGFGFKPIFDANWYGLSECRFKEEFIEPTCVVSSLEEQAEWIAAWGETPAGSVIFVPELLRAEVKFFFTKKEGVMESGLIANVGGGAVGISNTFGSSKGISECIKRACIWANGLPVVGYDSGAETNVLTALGFKALGKLRVWVR